MNASLGKVTLWERNIVFWRNWRSILCNGKQFYKYGNLPFKIKGSERKHAFVNQIK